LELKSFFKTYASVLDFERYLGKNFSDVYYGEKYIPAEGAKCSNTHCILLSSVQ
jgi:hypothetical protein